MGFGALAYDPMTGLAIGAEPDPAAPVALTPQGAVSKAVNRLAGTQFGEPRLQLWPEKLVRSAVTLPGDVASGEQALLPAGLRREDYTDSAPAARGAAEGIFGNTMFTPQPWQPNDPAYERAQDTAGLAGGGMMFGRLGAEATLGSGPVMRRNSMIENADLLRELANQRRARGEATGKSAPGWDFKRPEAPKGSWEDTVARTKAQWDTDKSRALAGFEDVVPPKNPSPYLSADDHAFLASGQFLSDSAAPGAPIAALEHAPKFYSGLERAVEGIPQPRMTGDQWLGTLNNRGVKPEEMDWTGLRGYLAERGNQPVTKAEVAEHLGANKLELGETTKGDTPWEALSPARRDRVAEDFNSIHPDVHTSASPDWNAVRDYYNKARANGEYNVGSGEGGTKFSSYLPGGENYREKLLTLPPTKTKVESWSVIRPDGHAESTWATKEAAQLQATKIGGKVAEPKITELESGYRSSHWAEPNVLVHRRTNERDVAHPLSAEELQAVEARKAAQPQIDAVLKQQDAVAREIQNTAAPLYEAYRSQIFADIKAGRISRRDASRKFEEGFSPPEIKSLQHRLQALRAQEDQLRASLPPEPNASKRSLHIEEIQSDWHQQGRKQGYREDQERRMADLVRQRDELIQKSPDKIDEINALHDQIADLGRSDPGVPDAPFKKNWHELALKDAIREAAEKGIERISWTPGEAQAARYDLSKQVHNIRTMPASDVEGARHVTINAKTGVHASATIDQTGKIIRGYDSLKDAAGKNLSEVIGKDVTERILKSEGVTELSGLDLKVGGEGMKGFYDKMIPDALNKIGKPHGVKVQMGAPATAPKVVELKNGRGEKLLGIEGSDAGPFRNMAELNKWWKENGDVPVHYMDIPQSLKDQALKKGFSLFEDAATTGVPLAAAEHDPAAGYHALIDPPASASPAAPYQAMLSRGTK